ncbi:DUF5707 domain-containing protein [Streptomyces sp. NPDC058620]|uniref:DUF5707 domain-containing protein n=1 Tax=Streptomyces sp. NPDC058620 TaxID=3346560 RepID=UPI0036555E8B
MKNDQPHCVTPPSSRAGPLSFSAEVQDDSGVHGLKVLVRPASAELDPTEAEMRAAARPAVHGDRDRARSKALKW